MIKDFKIMKSEIILSYSAPEIGIYEVAAECGYQTSSLLPGLGVEEDDLVY